MKITICTENFVEIDTSNELVEKVFEAHSNDKSLTNSEYEDLKAIISNFCELPNEDDYETGKDKGYWTCAYAEDYTPIYE